MAANLAGDLAAALARNGQWYALVRETEDGEEYVDLAVDERSQPVESVWFDPGLVTWGDEYQYSLLLGGDVDELARAILYTLRDDS
jgi:hypothetical protein